MRAGIALRRLFRHMLHGARVLDASVGRERWLAKPASLESWDPHSLRAAAELGVTNIPASGWTEHPAECHPTRLPTTPVWNSASPLEGAD